MENIFLHLVNMSITAGWLVLAVVLLRLVFHRAPKWIHCLLWVLVAIRLICPFSFESVLSLIPSAETVPVEDFLYDTPAIHSGVPVVDNAVNPIISNSFAPQPMTSVNPMQVVSILAAYVWALGMVMMALYMLITTLRLKWRVRESVRLQRNIWQCDRIATPFILGVIRPRIYLPTTLSDGDVLSVVAHEEAHIQRRDHWWKPLGFLLLTIYWFNPLLWLGYVLLCRDIEAACDQKVIRDMDVPQRKTYSETLLACSAPRHLVTACPLAFGETGVKSRVKAVLSYKKPAFWLIIVAVVAVAVAAVCLLTDPKTTMSDELDAYLTHVILEHNYSEEHTGDAYPTEAHTVFGVEKKAGKTVVYTMVLYEEYYLDENGALQVQSGSHIPTVITVDVEGNGYSLVEYWIPRDGTDYATDIREKYPIWYWWQTDTQRHVDKHQQKTLSAAEAHFGLNEEPYYEPIAGVFSVSHVFSDMNWLSQEKQEELYKDIPVDLDTQWLPVVPIATREELEAFIEKYNTDFSFDKAEDDGLTPAHQMREVYTDTFFAHNVLLAVYFKGPSSSLEPQIVALDYADKGATAQLLVDVYEPYMQNEALGQWFMLCSVPYTSLGNATKYTAVVRANIPESNYVSSFEMSRYIYQLPNVREKWRSSLTSEEWERLRGMAENLAWGSQGVNGAKAQHSRYIGAINLDGATYFVNDKYDVLGTEEQVAILTAEQSAFIRSLYDTSREGAVGPVPYHEIKDDWEGKTPNLEYTYLYGRYIGHYKAERYVILHVVYAENTDLTGKKVAVSLKDLPGFGLPDTGAMVEITYTGTVEETDGFPMVEAQGFSGTDLEFANDPGNVFEVTMGGEFTGKVTQVTDNKMLVECYDKNLCDTVWVNYTCFYPEMKPEVGDEYKINFADGVFQTTPPQVTGEKIMAVSYASERENNFITEAKAIEIASEHWKITSDDTKSIVVHIAPTFEKPIYYMSLRELIRLEDGTSQYNPIDGLHIHAVTGEIVKIDGSPTETTQSRTTKTTTSTSVATEPIVTPTTTTRAPTTKTTQVVNDDANTFVGKVTQVTGKGGTMLMECYDTSKFTVVSVSLRKFPELLPQVGDEYVVTHDGMVMETYPPQVVAEVITPVSSTPTQVSTTTQSQSFITESQAIAIASEYWNIKPGDRDPKTGFVMSIHAMETPTADKPHYRMALRWLVETEGGAGNFSTLDTIYIHAETGEIALPGGETTIN